MIRRSVAWRALVQGLPPWPAPPVPAMDDTNHGNLPSHTPSSGDDNLVRHRASAGDVEPVSFSHNKRAFVYSTSC